MNYYNLLIECMGYENAKAVAMYFEENKLILGNGKSIGSEVRLNRRGDGYWTVGISLEGLVSYEGHQPKFLEETVSELFSLLSIAPDYIAAAFGVDAIDNFSQMAIEEIILQGVNFGYLFLKDTVWERLGEPIGFEPFAEGYYWNPN